MGGKQGPAEDADHSSSFACMGGTCFACMGGTCLGRTCLGRTCLGRTCMSGFGPVAAACSSWFRALSARVRTWRPRASTVEAPVRAPSAPNSPTVLTALPLAGMPGSRNPWSRCVSSRSPGRRRASPGGVPRSPIFLRPRAHPPGRGARVCEPLFPPARGTLLGRRAAGLDRPLPQAPCLDRTLPWRVAAASELRFGAAPR